jgi:hypothetical protein
MKEEMINTELNYLDNLKIEDSCEDVIFYQYLKKYTNDKEESFHKRALALLHALRNNKILVFTFQKQKYPKGIYLKSKTKVIYSPYYNALLKASFDFFQAKHLNCKKYDVLENSWKLLEDKEQIINSLLFLHNISLEEFHQKIYGDNFSFKEVKDLNRRFVNIINDLSDLMKLNKESFLDMVGAKIQYSYV